MNIPGTRRAAIYARNAVHAAHHPPAASRAAITAATYAAIAGRPGYFVRGHAVVRFTAAAYAIVAAGQARHASLASADSAADAGRVAHYARNALEEVQG